MEYLDRFHGMVKNTRQDIQELEQRLERLVELRRRLETALDEPFLSQEPRRKCREALPRCISGIRRLREEMAALRFGVGGDFDSSADARIIRPDHPAE